MFCHSGDDSFEGSGDKAESKMTKRVKASLDQASLLARLRSIGYHGIIHVCGLGDVIARSHESRVLARIENL